MVHLRYNVAPNLPQHAWPKSYLISRAVCKIVSLFGHASGETGRNIPGNERH